MREKITLPNGVRIMLERMDGVHSASVGIWVGNGSRHEPASLSGISHFIEHIVFKGTRSRTAAQVAEIMDAIGGQVNAFTTKECTSFFIKALDTHLAVALDVLCDMFFEPRIDEHDVAVERGVIAEEIGMYEDTPEDLVNERLYSAVYKGTPLGRPILGSLSSLTRISARRMRQYMKDRYHSHSIIVSMAGSFSDSHVEFIKDHFMGIPESAHPVHDEVAYKPAFTTRRKPIEQNHLILAYGGLPIGSDERYAMQLLTSILGGGMSSRLFQEVRERRGLCYTIYAFSSSHQDTGVTGICTALSRETERDAMLLIRDEIRRFVQDGPKPEELDRAREQAKANLLMSMESNSSRMSHMGRSELFLGRVNTPDESAARFDAVTIGDVRALAGRLFEPGSLSFSAVGNVHDTGWYRAILERLGGSI